MSRLRLHIDQLVLRGFERDQGRALSEALQHELARVMADPSMRARLARSQRTPVLRLPAMALESGSAGARNFGVNLARALGRGLKP